MLLPPPLAMRREIEKLPETVRTLRTEQAVREHVEDLNHRIRRWIQIPVGPQVPLAPVDVDEIVAAWTEERRPTAPAAAAPSGPPPAPLVARPAPPPPPLTGAAIGARSTVADPVATPRPGRAGRAGGRTVSGG